MKASIINLIMSIAVSATGVNTAPKVGPAPWELTTPWQENLTQNEMDIFAQLVMAEAGNQNLQGKRLVADVVINRVNSSEFPDNVGDVIYQKKQFSCVTDGNFDKCAGRVTKECYDAIKLEYTSQKLDDGILYFSSTDQPVNGINAWKYQDHWFSY